VVPEVLDREALALAEEAGGWDERRTRSDLSQVLKRARRAARGETIEFMGREWDPRHHFHNETIIEWLKITSEEEREMIVTISAAEASRRKRLRDRKYQETRRRAKGVATRDQYEKNRTSSLRKRVAAARHLIKCGLSTGEIAERMGVTQRTVQKWLS
jgi:DNA-binding transcriptional regulator YiaG